MTLKNVTLAAAIVAVSLGPPHAANAQLHEDFDGYTTGVPPVPPWTEYYEGLSRADAATAGVVISIDDTVYYGDSGKSLHFLDTTSSLQGYHLLDFPSPMTSLRMTYYMRSNDATKEGAFVELRGDPMGPPWGTGFGQVGFGNAGGGGEAGWIGFIFEGWPEPKILPYSENTWYKVQRDLDLVADTEAITIWEIGTSNVATYDRTDVKGSYDHVTGIAIWTSGSQGADCYIDELTVVPEPATLALLATGSLSLLRRRRRVR